MTKKYKPIWIDPKIQTKFKLHCAKHEKSMKQLTESWIIKLMLEEETRHENIRTQVA